MVPYLNPSMVLVNSLGLEWGRTKLQGDDQLALTVVAGHDEPVCLLLLIVGQTFRIDPAIGHLQSDTVRTLAIDSAVVILNLGIADECCCWMLGGIEVSRISAGRHLEMDK